MQMNPLISVIIPLFNKEEYIITTINSVLDQKFDAFEILVIDDGSTDKSRLLVQNYKDDRIRLIVKKNGGVSSARNFGMGEAKGEFLFFLDADDEILVNCFNVFTELLKRYPNEKIFTTNFVYSENNCEKAYCKKQEEGLILNPYKEIFLLNIFPRTGNLFIHKDLVLDKCSFNESISISEDLDFIFRLIENNRIIYSPISTFIYKRENAELSLKNRNYSKEYISIAEVNGTFYKRIVISKYILNYYNGLIISLYRRFFKHKNEAVYLIMAYLLTNFNRLFEKIKKK